MAKAKRELIFVMTGSVRDKANCWQGFTCLGWNDGNGPPRVYERDRYDGRLRGFGPLPYCGTFCKAVRHWGYFVADKLREPKDPKPCQVPASMLREFGFTKREIIAALDESGFAERTEEVLKANGFATTRTVPKNRVVSIFRPGHPIEHRETEVA